MKTTMTTIDHSRPIPSLLLLLLLTCAKLASAQPSSGSNSPQDPSLPYKFNPSMLIIIFVLISAFFFMGFFSIYVRQCAGESQSAHGGRQNGGRGGRSRPFRGLDQNVIDTFPILEYSVVKGLKLGKSTLECAVCLNEFEDDETLRLLPKCSHVFHPDCIDMWLSSHTTCPVCRANLVPGSDTEAPVPVTMDPGTVSAGEAESSRDHVAITVDPAPSGGEVPAQPDVINPSQIPFPIQNRPIRSKSSRRPSPFPRSHSTGHSLVHPGENLERYTLRLPEHVRKEIMSRRLNKTTSLVAFPTAEGGSVSGGSSRGGRWYRGGGEGSSRGRTGFSLGRFDRSARSDRWVFSMAPPFVSRTGSVKSSQKRVDGEMSGSSKGGFPSVMTPFDCLGAKGEASEQEPARASTPAFTVSSQ